MNNHTLSILAYDNPTILERILQVTRYRGFAVTGLSAYSQVEGQLVAIELLVRSVREVHLLTSQLNKLIDVSEIKIHGAIAQQCSA